MIFIFLFSDLFHSVQDSRFIHFTGTDSNMLLFMAELYSIVYMYHNFFSYLSADGHLGCFHVLVIANSAAVNNRVRVSFSVLA